MRRRPGAWLPLLLGGALLGSACATARGGWAGGWWTTRVQLDGPSGPRGVELRYKGGPMPAGWSSAASPPADFAFWNEDLRATVYADTSCGPRYQDSPLPILANNLTFGFTELETASEWTLTLSAREGLERVSRGKLDGVPMALAVSVLKKGPCVFDLVYVAAPATFEAGLPDYRAFRDGFEAEFSP